MKPLGPCGRCPGCRAAGAAVQVDPPPRPRQVWATGVELSEELRSFAAAARGQHGLVVLVERPGEDLGDALAAALGGDGVQHLAGDFAGAAVTAARGAACSGTTRRCRRRTWRRCRVSRASAPRTRSRALGCLAGRGPRRDAGRP